MNENLLASVAKLMHADRVHPHLPCPPGCVGPIDEDWTFAREVTAALIEMDDGTCGLCGHTQGKHRHDHPATAKRAAASISLKNKQAAHWRILMALYNVAMTDEDMQKELEMNPNTQRPRRVELVEKGWVEPYHHTKFTESGREAMLWELSDAGYLVVENEMREMAKGRLS